MGFNLSNFIKKNNSLYILLKSKFNFNYLKAFKAIENLNLIDSESYLKVHKDCNHENMNCIAHYLFFGRFDSFDIKKTYINPIFDLGFYLNKYPCDDPIIDFVIEGISNNKLINPYDRGYINSINQDINEQFFNGSNLEISNYLDSNFYITDKQIVIPYLLSEREFNTDTIKIGVFFNDSFKDIPVCFYIRIHNIFKKLSKSGKFTFFMYGMDSYSSIDFNEILKVKSFDFIVVQRIFPFIDILLEKASKFDDIKLIYETDDDLLGVEENSPSYEYVNNYRKKLTDYINHADLITVTTNELAKRFNNKNIEVIKNYFVDGIYPLCDEIADNERIKIGYYGSLTHSKDILLIKDVIITLKNKLKEEYNIEFDFEIIGGFNKEDNIHEDWYNEIPLPDNSINFENFMKFLSNNAKWDIGIAPLENSYFNMAKSELKYIELSSLGIPAVFSDVSVYNSVIKDGYNGFLAKNNEEWINKLEKLILDKELRKYILNNAIEDIRLNYSSDIPSRKWEYIFTNF